MKIYWIDKTILTESVRASVKKHFDRMVNDSGKFTKVLLLSDVEKWIIKFEATRTTDNNDFISFPMSEYLLFKQNLLDKEKVPEMKKSFRNHSETS